MVRDTPDPQRQVIGRVGGLTSWANTVDRTARTNPARQKSPGSVAYWVDRLGPEFAEASAEQRHAAAEAARRAYYARLSLKAVQARRNKAGAA